MKCPLIVTGNKTRAVSSKDPSSDCLKEECAWWNYKAFACSLLCISQDLHEIYEEFQQIVIKMPHELQFRK